MNHFFSFWKTKGLLLFFLLCPLSTQAIVILDSTYQANGGEIPPPNFDNVDLGYRQHVEFSLQPQFHPVGLLEAYIPGNNGIDFGIQGSATWIGNQDGYAYLLTAGHMVTTGSIQGGDFTVLDPTAFKFTSISGTIYSGAELFVHPNWDGDDENDDMDLAILRLELSIDELGAAPLLYSGDQELGLSVASVGYGTRGLGSTGYDPDVYGDGKRAAATNVISDIDTFLLAYEFNDIPTLGSLEGGLAPGDSGGSTWAQFGDRWIMVGVHSSITGEQQYGDLSISVRTAAHQTWIEEQFPQAQFAIPEPSTASLLWVAGVTLFFLKKRRLSNK